PADVKCLGFLYLYVGRYPRNNASRNTLRNLRSCLETRNLLRWRPNCVLASRRGQKLRRVVHYSPYFCPHRALHGSQSERHL
ncbi:MAG: hypothetical protein BECKG1743F_GA0114225_102571, partial [Candidatus Kentron sp. G]